jgi:mRNA interferase MazF
MSGTNSAAVTSVDRAVAPAAPLSVVLIAPTSASPRAALVRSEVELLGSTTRVLVEQVGAVDVNRPGEPIGRVGVEGMWNIHESLATVPGLN